MKKIAVLILFSLSTCVVFSQASLEIRSLTEKEKQELKKKELNAGIINQGVVPINPINAVAPVTVQPWIYQPGELSIYQGVTIGQDALIEQYSREIEFYRMLLEEKNKVISEQYKVIENLRQINEANLQYYKNMYIRKDRKLNR